MISDLIPSVNTTDTGSQVLSWMDLYRVAHLPVVEQAEYLGLVSDSDIFNFTDPEQPIGKGISSYSRIYITEDQHIFEGIDLISRFKLTLLPVLSREKNYLGGITLVDLTRHFSRLSASDQPGAIIVLVVPLIDYSLTGISRIVEENNAKILSLYVAPEAGSGDLTITIKLNTSEISSIIRSFERFGYAVIEHFLDDEQLDDLYRNRFEEFMRYINI